MPRCDAIERFTHDFDVDFPVPSKNILPEAIVPIHALPVCPMQTCSPRWGWIPLEDTWQLGWHQATPSRLLEKSQQKSSMFAKICQGHRWFSVVLTNIGIISQARATHGKVALSAVATCWRGDGAPGGDKKRQKSSDSSIFSQWISAIPSPLLLVLRGFTMFYMGF